MSAVAGLQRPVQADALSVVLGLGQRARRAATARELAFVMVNETRALASYRQAFLWTEQAGIEALSGVATAERHAPFAIWLDRLMRRAAASLDGPRSLTQADFAGIDRTQWPEWLPAHLLLLPMVTPRGAQTGIIGFAREEGWSEAETLFLSECAEAYGLAWAWHQGSGAWSRMRRHMRRSAIAWMGLALGAACLCCAPVRLSVLAPGEVVAHDPAAMRAPIDGVIETVFVRPNQHVTKDMPLFTLDTTVVGGKLEVAQKALATAQSEYEQAAQQAFDDPKAKAQLGILAGHIGERKAEIDYYRDLMQRSEVKASRDGIAVMDDPSDWVGKPVSVGEKVLAIADEGDTELEGWLSPADLIDLPVGATATLFANADPLHPLRARLDYVAYESMVRQDGMSAHRLRASWVQGTDRPRLGLKGTIRLDGPRVKLIYWMCRRPLAVIRQATGL